MVQDQLNTFLEKHKNKREDWIKENLSDLFLFIDSLSTDNIQWKEKLYRHLNNITIIPTCYCGSSLEYLGFGKGYRKYCSTKCLSNSDEVKNKRKSTSIIRYGYDNPMKSEEIKKVYSDSIMEKYGIDNVSKLESTKEKVRISNNSRFGVDYVSQTSSVRESLSQKMKIKSRDLNFIKDLNLREYLSKKTTEFGIKFVDILDTSVYSFSCEVNHIFQIHKNMLNDRIKHKNTICTICNPIDNQSDSERNLLLFIKSIYLGKIETNIRNVINGEIDIYLPELKIGFEYNGLYWHSDEYKDSKYHLRKSNECRDIGIKLIHVWEDDWINKNEIVKSRISNLLGSTKKIWARRCLIRDVNWKDSKKFLEENHIQGGCFSRINLGLFFGDEIICIMSFGGLRKSLGQSSKFGSYEMLRFCSKIGTTVVGGASKLMSHFIKTYNPSEVISYADKSWSDGSLYRRLGFSLLHETNPNYFWIVDGIRRNRFNFRKDKLVKEGYDPNKSESEIMKDLGYHKIYDSGSYKFIFSIQK